MFYFLSVLILLASLGLVLLVIVQKSKGGGLASPFASTNNIMGVRKTTDVLEKATWWLFGIVAVPLYRLDTLCRHRYELCLSHPRDTRAECCQGLCPSCSA